MGISHLARFMLLILYSGGNSIGPQGCEYLNEIQCINLTEINLGIIIIYLGKNNIGDEGCKHLSNAKWDKLIKLDLGL